MVIRSCLGNLRAPSIPSCPLGPTGPGGPRAPSGPALPGVPGGPMEPSIPSFPGLPRKYGLQQQKNMTSMETGAMIPTTTPMI